MDYKRCDMSANCSIMTNFQLSRSIRNKTHIVNTLNPSERSRHGLANNRNIGEEARLANEDVEISLVDADKLLEGGGDGRAFIPKWLGAREAGK